MGRAEETKLPTATKQIPRLPPVSLQTHLGQRCKLPLKAGRPRAGRPPAEVTLALRGLGHGDPWCLEGAEGQAVMAQKLGFMSACHPNTWAKSERVSQTKCAVCISTSVYVCLLPHEDTRSWQCTARTRALTSLWPCWHPDRGLPAFRNTMNRFPEFMRP